MATIQFYKDEDQVRLFDGALIIDIIQTKEHKKLQRKDISHGLKLINYKIKSKWIKTEWGRETKAYKDYSALFIRTS